MLELLRDLQTHKSEYLRTETGEDFEDRIENRLRQRYSKIVKKDIDPQDLRLLKENILKKEDPGFLQFSSYPRTFIKTLFGSQDYPDFIVFTSRFAVPVEIKYSLNQPKPVWNSGLPRPNGLYIFGSHGQQDITFFRQRRIK